MNTLVSAVITTLNRPILVCRAVQSALGQSYSEIEVIVVVDGPDPTTVNALEALKEPRLRVITLTENAGGSEARNVGIRESRGDWIALLDDDDEWLTHKIEKQIAALPLGGAEYCLVTCCRLQREAGRPDELRPKRLPLSGEDISEYMFYSGSNERHVCGPQSSGYFATKRLFLDVPFSTGLKCHQDWDWYLRAMHHPETVAVMLEEPLYIMYVEPERPRMTQQAKVDRSLKWAESRKDLFTPRAYSSFLINEIMHRCEERSGRVKVFRKLVSLCRQSTTLKIRDMIAIAKWFVFTPSLRMRLVRCLDSIRSLLRGGRGNRSAVSKPPTKLEGLLG